MALPSHRNTEWALSSTPRSTEIPLTKARERLPSLTGHHSAKPQIAQAVRPQQHFPLLLCAPTWQSSHLQTGWANCCLLLLTHLPYSSQAAPPQPDSHYSARKAAAPMSARRHTGSEILTIIILFLPKGLQAELLGKETVAELSKTLFYLANDLLQPICLMEGSGG